MAAGRLTVRNQFARILVAQFIETESALFGDNERLCQQ